MQTKPILLCLVIAFVVACDGSINAPIQVADGTRDAQASQTINGSIQVGNDVTVTSGAFRTVNGRVRVGDRSVVPGISAVNGSITIGESSRTGELETVNGGISIGAGTETLGLTSVNGAIHLGAGAKVVGDVEGVNGRITVGESGHVTGGLSNVNGGMVLETGAVLEGDLFVLRPRGTFSFDEKPVIRIGPVVRVAGRLVFERDVDLYIHRSAEIGEIVGAEPIWIEEEAPEAASLD